ncbi:conserved hypothetical protein [Thermosulfidibacter takaii ABI70S6]|uniref:Demethylmenaquinone methyltransferase n=1 Tax=Thermosulfidibacter takaii (strain DSM 17441 / JCM 13301 / NBRC 103674 / ABI70S6) TaxID=1298851 RepID=A0A0S3QRT6_THET7|nr:class I SAM-dependent methyltransferase [Thermosulfidibacter takaii]BAT71043.1 conserved hypothetical protein [Thermosulfidibacter takaii ABI70S6]
MDPHFRFRQAYYNIFSKIYDKFVQLHSGDKRQSLRRWLVKTAGLKPGMRVLDLCTGTGAVANTIKQMYGDQVEVVAIDFSLGMLNIAKNKNPRVYWVLGNVTQMPFKSKTFDVVFCAYAFYELKDEHKLETLSEIKRVLKAKGKFLMMEHEEPKKRLIRFLYKVRLATMGSFSSSEFVRKEMALIGGYFKTLKKIVSPSGNSKIIVASKN